MRSNIAAHSAISTEGMGEGMNNLVSGHLAGGIGKSPGIRGTMRLTATAGLESGFNDARGEIEYWMEK